MTDEELKDITERGHAARLSQIKQRLVGVSDSKPWKFDTEHPMFIGTTNAVVMRDRVIDLGRSDKVWVPYQDEHHKGYRLSEQSVRNTARIKSLGEFLESCREDMEWMLQQLESK